MRKVPGATPATRTRRSGSARTAPPTSATAGADGHPKVSVSHDHGETWDRRVDVGAQLGIQNTVFPAVVAGDDDRAAFAYLGSTTVGGKYQDQAFHGVWHLYVATTYDGGKTWVTVDATPNDPVQRGSICTGGTTLRQRPQPARLHGRHRRRRTAGCGRLRRRLHRRLRGSRVPNSFSALATIARQVNGPRLFAKYDVAVRRLRRA